MKKKHVLSWILFFIGIMGIIAVAAAVKLQYMRLESRAHGKVAVESYEFTESDRDLKNLNRGFYHMNGFILYEEATDFRENVFRKYSIDEDTTLTLVEINLQRFRDKDISQTGIENLENLLDTLGRIDKQIILRFCYDWDGNNLEVEPESIDIILRHMEQIGPLLQEHKDVIFTLQGLFVGNWGEMNNTRYGTTDDIRTLSEQLARVTDADTFLAVRTPAHWRRITQSVDFSEISRGDGSLASRMGLYNDGMLGNWNDVGTYGSQSQAEDGFFAAWNRTEELAFQEELCKRVPNGGEVIIDNEYNDFENAIADMASMHVTYINQDYDSNVLNKWMTSTYDGGGCFNGMDGLSYIERHLGYRLLIHDVELYYDLGQDFLSVDVTMQNVGFAPLYRKTNLWVHLYNREADAVYSYKIDQDLWDLTGGNDADALHTLHKEISLSGQHPGSLEVYFEIRDVASGNRILMANTQDPQEYGYLIGEVSMGTLEELWEEWKMEMLPHRWRLGEDNGTQQ